MPHKCTGCGRQFADGSKEMLSGCPDCGGSKFQFMPAGGAPAAEEPPEPPQPEAGAVAETVGAATTKLRDFVGEDPPAPADAPEQSADTVGEAVGSIDAEEGVEDGAQSSARSEMVSPEELPDDPPSVGAATTGVPDAGGASPSESRGTSTPDAGDASPPDAGGDSTPDSDEGGRNAELPNTVGDEGGGARVVDTPSEERPDLSELREELNDQFEGIRICERGEYELNLMELYEREETIIALQENGRYVIEPPESWHGDGS
jgi:predicted  nucleic acid-binding Zn-ribbon protein